MNIEHIIELFYPSLDGGQEALQENGFKKMRFNIAELANDYIKFSNFKNIDDEYVFYYDETNNIRKLWFKDTGRLNIPRQDLTKNFVLGGLVHHKDERQFNIDNLKQKLKLQKTVKEIKLGQIAQGDFITCLKSYKLEILLDWLYSNNFYIHYSSINFLYWSLVDIIDSVIDNDLLIFQNEIKTILYEMAMIDLDAFLGILYEYDYPNIKREQAKEFLDVLSQYLILNRQKLFAKYLNANIDFLVDAILKLIKDADMQDLTFIMDEKDHTLIDTMGHFYLRPLGLFKNSLHIFDEENTIQDFMNQYDLYNNENGLENFEFKNSMDCDLIQLSDVVAGLIGKLFDYVNKITFDEVGMIKNELDDRQQKNFQTFAMLILRSDEQSRAFIHSIQGLIDRDKFSSILSTFCGSNV